MLITAIRIIRVIKAAPRRRACRPVIHLWCILLHNGRQDSLIHDNVVANLRILAHPGTNTDEFLHLIVTAHQSKRRMMTDTFQIINKFLCDGCLKCRCQVIYSTGKHKVFPHNQSHLITEIKEPIVRIVSATPYTNGIEVGKYSLFQ